MSTACAYTRETHSVDTHHHRTTLQIALIAKPKDAAVIKELQRAVKWLRSQGHVVHPRLTFDKNDAIRFARLATRKHADLIIAAGGDGTINEVVNGIARMETERIPRLAVIPLGTANDFAKGLQIPASVQEAAELAVRGNAVDVDIAEVNHRCFVNVSTGGFGPDITEESSSKSKARFGKLAYLFTAVKKLSDLQPMHATFKSDSGILYDGPFFFFAVGNARQTGGGTQVTPCADYSDSQLDVAVVTGEKKRDFISLLPDLRAGKHPSDPDVLYIKTRTLDVDPTNDIAVNADGEPVKGNRFEYRILSRRIGVMRA